MRDSIANILRSICTSKTIHEQLLTGLLESLRALSPKDVQQIKRFLSSLDSPWRGFRWKKRFAKFQRLDPAEQLATLARAMDKSSPVVQHFLQAVLRQINYLRFAAPESQSLENAHWREMGYTVLRGGEWEADEVIKPARIRVQQTSFAAEYLVIGSGAGGSVAAAELAETGKRVLLVDAGPIPTPGELGQTEHFANQHWHETHDALGSPTQPVAITAGRVFGGGTISSWGSCVDPPMPLLDHWANQFGFTECLKESYRHSLYSVRRRLGIEACGTPNQNNQLFQAACEQLQWKTTTYEQNRGTCSICSTCGFGCASGKQDALRTYLLDASRLGVLLLPSCRIEKFEIRDGHAERALGILQDESGHARSVEFQFRHAILSAGAIHSPGILLKSGVSNPHIGQHLQLQPAVTLLAEFDHPVEAWNGPPHSLGCTQFSSRTDGPGFRIECVPLHPGLLAMNLPWRSPEAHRKLMMKARFIGGLMVTVHDIEEFAGQVQLGRNGSLHIQYRPTRTFCQAIATGLRASMICLRAAGAKRIFSPVASISDFNCSLPPECFDDYCHLIAKACRNTANLKLWSAFPSSTCRLAASAAKGAIDTTGRVFGLNNVYVCDAASLPTNPCLPPLVTVTTTAHFLCQKIKQRTT